MNRILTFLLLFIFGFAQAQQLNCVVTVDSQRLSATNQQVFKTLETSISEFLNKTDWTGQALKQSEKINCSMYITVSSNSSDQFTATIQVQSSRPVFNSSYASPVLNYNDKDFNFRYIEFENLIFNPTTFDSNLVSVLAFYSYMILAMDADTFVLESGTPNFEIAQNIANVAQQGGSKGWSQADGNQNRYFLINDILSPTFKQVRQTMFDYHTGLDLMSQDLKASKEKIKGSLVNLAKLNLTRPNAFLTRVFFDAKSDEIVSVFSGGPSITISDLVDNLNKISPLNSSKWLSIKY
ncbi:type IX secretion system protein PorD [Flavobacterium sp. CAN_S2]|uniref:type IX secretion system protein PorD n=1 Tax=Flavobacterium sp. CAN_S2 TaxID=2787726 RepID=UPI0018CB0C70